jgi:hypothetical protein
MLISFLVITTVLAIQFNEANAQTLEEQFNDCLRKSTIECPSIEDVRKEKLNTQETTVEPPTECVEKPYHQRKSLWECQGPHTPYTSFVWHGPGHDDDDQLNSRGEYVETPEDPNPWDDPETDLDNHQPPMHNGD